MRHVRYIAKKELLQIRRDRLAVLFTVVLPVVFTVFLGLVIPNTSENDSRLPLALANIDETPAAQQLVDRLEESPLLELKTIAANTVDKAVQDQQVAGALVIPAGYGAAIGAREPATLSFVRIETSSGAQSVWQAVQQIVGELSVKTVSIRTVVDQVSAKTGRILDKTAVVAAHSLVETQLATPIAVAEVTNAGASTDSHAGGFDQSSTGSLVNWVLFSLLGTAAGMVWERRRGLLRRLSVAGVYGREVIGGKVLSMVIITFLQQLLLVLLGQLAFGVDYFSSPLALFVTMVSLSMLAATFGLLVATVFRSEQAVITTTVISAQLLAVLGGAWFPLEITGATFSRVAHFFPSAWIMDSLHGIILKGWGVTDVLVPMGIVWVWILVLLAVAVWRFRPV